MSKTLKILLWSVAGIIILIILFLGAYMIKFKSEVSLMTPLETGKLIDNIYVIKDDFVNVYIIREGKKAIVIDCGNDIEAIKKGFEELKINTEDVVAVLLTHSDGDHVKALNLFKNAEIYLSHKEEQMINGQTSRFLFFGNSIGNNKYRLLEDNQVFTIAATRIEGILTPGHTPGLMCYLINDKYLFTGDAFSLKNGKIDEFNNFFNMDSKVALKSIEKIKKLKNIDYIFTAHYGFSDNFQKAISEID